MENLEDMKGQYNGINHYCYYNKNGELIIGRSPRDYTIVWEWYEKDTIKEKLINDINKEKFKLSIYYMKKKLPDDIIYEISTYL